MQELLDKIDQIKGLMDHSMEPSYWQDITGKEVPVKLIMLVHSFDAFNDPIYEELLDRFPENTDEYEEEDECYISTFICYEV